MAVDISDGYLIERVREGHLDAFEEVMLRHASRLRAFIAMRLPVPHLVEEIAHETFVWAYRHIDEYEEGTDLSRWLRSIAYNLVRAEVLRYSRGERNQEKYLEHCLVEQAGRELVGGADAPMAAFLEECVDRLPEGQRSLLLRRYRLAETSEEIAKALGKSEAWVRTTLFRIRTALRDCIEQKAGRQPA